MKNLRLTEQRGIAQIFLLIGMVLVAVSLPFATRLVQQNQENRSNAATNKRTADYCSKKDSLDDCKNDDGCYYVATGGWFDTYNSVNCIPSKIRGEKCSDSKTCYEGLSCESGFCVNSTDCVHTKSGKIIPDKGTLCWDWVVYTCSSKKLNQDYTCGAYSGSNTDKVGCTGNTSGSCTFSTAQKKPCCANNANQCDFGMGPEGELERKCTSPSSIPTGADGKKYETVSGNLLCPTSGYTCYYGYKPVKSTPTATLTLKPTAANNKCSSSNCSYCDSSNCSDNGCIWNNGTGKCLAGDGSAAQNACKNTTGTVKKCVGNYLYTCIYGSPQWTTGGSPEYCGTAGCKDGVCNAATSTPKPTATPTPKATPTVACNKTNSGKYICYSSAVWKCDTDENEESVITYGWVKTTSCTYGCKTTVVSDTSALCAPSTSNIYSASSCSSLSTPRQTLSLSACGLTESEVMNGKLVCCGDVCKTCDSKAYLSTKCENNKVSVCQCDGKWSDTTDCATGMVCNTAKTACIANNKCSSSNCSYCDSSNCSANGCIWNNGTGKCLAGDGSAAQNACKNTTGTVKKCVVNYLYTCIYGSPQWTGGSPEYCGTAGCKDGVCNAAGGSPATNSSACKAKGGVCATYTSALKTGDSCQVTGYTKIGSVVTGLCSGDSKTVCCTGITAVEQPSNPVDPVSPVSPVDPVSPVSPVDPVTVPATKITLNPTTVALMVGGTKVITATVEPSNSTDAITWTSSNTAVAAVSTSGVITGAGVGTATITATTASGKTATVSVTVTAAAAGSVQVSFKFAFFGVKPGAACMSSLGNLDVEVANVPTNTYQSGLSTGFAKLEDSEVDINGNQIFQVTALSLDATKFGSVNEANYIKIKGPFHLRRRMCADGQSSKVPETTVCKIDLTRTDSHIYDFSNYALLSGDINRDGIVNGVDFGLVKTVINSDDSVSCGRQGDLNLDGIINGIDTQIIKITLLERDDE